MTFPPFKSMYLLKGVTISLVIWFWLSAWLVSRAPTPSPIDSILFVMSLCIFIFMGWVFATIRTNADRVRSFIIDDQLPDHERDTLIAIRAASPWAKDVPTKVLASTWREWSKIVYFIEGHRDFDIDYWLDGTNPRRVKAFLSWAFTRPIDRY